MENLPIIGPIIRSFSSQKAPPTQKAEEKTPYPAYFKKLTATEVSEEGKIKKAIILDKGLKAMAVQQFVRVVWGGKVLSGLKQVAREQKPVNEQLKKGMIADKEKREKQEGAPAFRERGFDFAQMKTDAAKMPQASASEIAQAHWAAIQVQGNRCEPIQAGDGNYWIPMRVSRDHEGKLQVTRNTVCSTSERTVGVSNDLTNIYFHISDAGHISITCGVIDTEEKAQHFMTAVAEAVKDRNARFPETEAPPLRICMHQLNSMGTGPAVIVSERPLVQRQREMAGYINSHLKSFLNLAQDPPYVVHNLRCMNGFTHLPGEDANAMPINREGLAIQMGWLSGDLRKEMASLDPDSRLVGNRYSQAQNKVDQSIGALQRKKEQLALLRKQHMEQSPEMRNLKKNLDAIEVRIINLQIKMLDLSEGDHAQLVDLRKQQEALQEQKRVLMTRLAPDQDIVKAKMKNLEKEIKALDGQLKGELKELVTTMHAFENKLAGDPKYIEMHAKIHIATRILAMQTGMAEKLGVPKLTPAQQLAYQFLLDRALHTITEINCKSGLDRSGLARSLQNAVEQKIKNGESLSSIVIFLGSFENSVQAMDREFSEELRRHPQMSFQTWLNGDGSKFQDIHNFQEAVLAELVNARRITGNSTGVEGLKWHHSKNSINPFEKNPHPLPFIPIYGKTTQGMVRLIQIDEKGRRSFTKEGLIVLEGLSAKRGG